MAFLIHGYNVDPMGADAAFKRLRDTIRRVSMLPALLESQSWLVLWDGYVSGGLGTGKTLLSPASYPKQIPSACEAAQALKRYIDEENQGKAPVTLIAHSLGCRLALELLEAYADESAATRPEFPLVVLMAAAVPTFFFEELQRLQQGAHLPERVLVLFSYDDVILTRYFRVGQTLAGEGIFPQAVGATGKPHGFWQQPQQTFNNHSGYFGDDITARKIAGALGQAVAVGLPTFHGGAALPADMRQELPESSLPSRYFDGER